MRRWRVVRSTPSRMGGFRNIAVAGGQQCAKIGAAIVDHGDGGCGVDMLRKVLHRNQPVVAKGGCKSDRIVQLADIARPAVVQDRQPGSVGERQWPTDMPCFSSILSRSHGKSSRSLSAAAA